MCYCLSSSRGLPQLVRLLYPLMAQAYAGCRDHISVQDLEWFLPPTKAANALSVLDIDGDGKISLSDMRDAVVSIYKERKNLAFTLKVAFLLAQLLK